MDAVVAAEGGEQGDRGVDQALGLGDHDRAPPEAGQPVPLAGVVALDPVRLVLAGVEPAQGDQPGVGRPLIRAIEARAPAPEARDQLGTGGLVTTAQLPIDEPS